VHIWPSLHCLLPPGGHDALPKVLDTGVSYEGEATPFDGTVDVTRGMKYGLFRLRELVPAEVLAADDGLRCFVEWLEDRGPAGRNVMSACDGGQLMFHVLKRAGGCRGGEKGAERGGILFNAHLGAYEGIVKAIHPQPDLVVQGIAGRANLNGRPFKGSAAGFAAELLRWLGEPERVIWCLHDEWWVYHFSSFGPGIVLTVREIALSNHTGLIRPLRARWWNQRRGQGLWIWWLASHMFYCSHGRARPEGIRYYYEDSRLSRTDRAQQEYIIAL
jgi:hypothetical protein